MNLLRRMLSVFVSPARHDPDLDRLKGEVFTQRSAHQSAITQTIQNEVSTSALIEEYRNGDAIMFPRRHS